MPAVVPAFVKIDAGAAVPSVARGSENLRDTAGAIAALGAVTGQHWARLAGALSLTGVAGERLLVPAMKWLANDPPDRNYMLSVRLKRSHLHPSDEFDVGDAMVKHALQGFRDIDSAAAALRAMLRAFEREEGADLAEAGYAAERRHEEGVHFRALAIHGLNATAWSYRTLADDQAQLRSTYDDAQSKPERQHVSLEESKRLLIESGVPESLAEVLAPGRDWQGIVDTAGTLIEAADTCETLAEALERW